MKKNAKADLTRDFWKNVKVMDATQMMRIFPSKIDLDNAVPSDPEHCVYAECIRRVIPQARRIRIWRNVALVESRDDSGQTIVLRYIISSKGRRALKRFDRGIGELVPCTLLPPTVSTRLDAKKIKRQNMTREQMDAFNAYRAQRQKDIQSGLAKPRKISAQHLEIGLRSGTGHQFYHVG